MEFSTNSNKHRVRNGIFWVAVCLLAQLAASQGQEFKLESAGIRGGFAGNDSSGDFHQAEAFMDWNLPWGWDLGSQLRLQTRLDASLGWLGDSHHSAVIGSAGPMFALTHARIPLSLDGGISPTFLSRSEFESKDIGTEFQFTSYIGLNWDFAPNFRVGYRFQHMSNAGFSNHNPGLNMHMFSLSYVF
jgi:Lipid A 3-O-deacylase (PagL)